MRYVSVNKYKGLVSSPYCSIDSVHFIAFITHTKLARSGKFSTHRFIFNLLELSYVIVSELKNYGPFHVIYLDLTEL